MNHDEEITPKIGFVYTDEFGYKFSQTSDVIDLDGILDGIGRCFVNFIRQIGYSSFNKDYFLMEALDEDELVELTNYLSKLRYGKENENGNQD